MSPLKTIIKYISILFIVYLIGCSFMFFSQENLLFFPKKISLKSTFHFSHPHQEIFLQAKDGANLHGLLFRADSSKGLIFYLHGNAGALDSWGWSYQTYTDLYYDFFILDYRGYGKSGGEIESENQLFEDVQTAYNQLKKEYKEEQIIVIGYSMGTCPAAKIVAENKARMLILQAPYYSMIDMKDQFYPFLPDFLVRYKFETFKYLEKITVPVYIFHGNQDEVIYYGSSKKLQNHLKTDDRLITLSGQGHNGMNDNPEFRRELRKIILEDQNLNTIK